MTVFVDTSALLTRYLRTADTDAVGATMAAHPTWVFAASARAEVLHVLRLATSAAHELAALEALARADLDAGHVVPVDDRCLVRAAEIGAAHRIALVDALPLAAADRLARPTTYLTLAGDQVPAALTLGFDVAPG